MQLTFDFNSPKIKSISRAVRTVIDSYPVGHEFSGLKLKNDVVVILPSARETYPDTILRRMRQYRRLQIQCIDAENSLYKKICK